MFASERARQQVMRVMDYVAFPGLALLTDETCRVLAASGDVSGVAHEPLAAMVAWGRRDLLDASLPEGHYGLIAELHGGLRLCVVYPGAVSHAAAWTRVEQARKRLARMLVARPSHGPGPDGAPAVANALWIAHGEASEADDEPLRS